jgi:hypothetical protein
MTSGIDKLVGPVVGKATGIITPRTILVSVIPAVALWIAISALIGTQLGWASVHGRWTHLDLIHRISLAAVAVGGIALSAAVMASAERAVIMIYEGHWNRSWQQSFRDWATKRQQGQREKLAGSPNAHRFYPQESSGQGFMPTRLGNILRAAESYPDVQLRYRLNGVLWWPRFFLVIPETVRSDLSTARASMTLRLHMSFVSAIFVVVTGLAAGVFALTGTAASWLVWCVAGLVAVLNVPFAYQRALGPALIYGDLTRCTFDLYRAEVLNRMGLAMPETLAEERELWFALNQLVARGSVSSEREKPLNDARKRYAAKPGS